MNIFQHFGDSITFSSDPCYKSVVIFYLSVRYLFSAFKILCLWCSKIVTGCCLDRDLILCKLFLVFENSGLIYGS